MTTSVLRVTSNERVDLEDFLFAVDEALRAQSRQTFDQFFSDPARATRAWIVSGFEATGTGTGNVTVTRGRAVLGQREVGQVFYGALTTEGELTRIVDVSGFANGTYGVYLRFELIDGETESRAFWNPAGLGSEVAQTVATRRLANWSVRVELTIPGAEWIKVADAVVAGGLITGITDRRNFFFEGEVDQAYRSGWSTDGGGVANDRSATRKTYGAHDLHTFLAATRQCLEDIKGRGLRRWWDPGIGGLNVGFDTNPIEDRLAVGDANCYIYNDIGGAVIQYVFSAGDIMEYDRAANIWNWLIGSATVKTQNATLASFYTDLNIRTGGAAVGFIATAAQILDDTLMVGDLEFYLQGHTTDPALVFDVSPGLDSYSYDRTNDYHNWGIAGVVEMRLQSTGLAITNGLNVGFSGTILDDTVSVGDADFAMAWAGGTAPGFKFDTGGKTLTFDRTAGGGTGKYAFTPGWVRLVGLAADPTPAALGDLFTNTQNGQIAFSNGVKWHNLNTFIHGNWPAEAATAGAIQRFADTAAVVANTLRVGSILKFHAHILMDADAGRIANTTKIGISSTWGAGWADSTLWQGDVPVDAFRVSLEGYAYVNSIGAGGDYRLDCRAIESKNALGSLGNGYNATAQVSINTTVTTSFKIHVESDESIDFTLVSFYFEVI